MDYFVIEKRMFGNRSRLNFSASEVFIKVLFDYFLHEKRRFLTHSKKIVLSICSLYLTNTVKWNCVIYINSLIIKTFLY